MISFNTNLFETNIINLIFVIVVLVYLGGDLLKDSLTTRKEKILEKLNALENRQLQSLQELENATKQVEKIGDQIIIGHINNFQDIWAQNKNLKELASQKIRQYRESKATRLMMEQKKGFRTLLRRCKDKAVESAIQLSKSKMKTYPIQHAEIRKMTVLWEKQTSS